MVESPQQVANSELSIKRDVSRSVIHIEGRFDLGLRSKISGTARKSKSESVFCKKR